jgi:hypothetical protein
MAAASTLPRGLARLASRVKIEHDARHVEGAAGRAEGGYSRPFAREVPGSNGNAKGHVRDSIFHP